MLPLATVEQLSARLGITPTGGDAERALAALEDASALIRSEAAIDWIDVDNDELSGVPSVIEAITLAVAYRAYQNPSGASQTILGDPSVSYAREGSGAVYLTRDERKAVRKAAGISSVGSIALVSPWMAEAANYYVEVEGGGDPIPLGPFPWEL